MLAPIRTFATQATYVFQDECKIITESEGTEGTMNADTLLDTP